MATQPETTFPSSLAVRGGHVTILWPMGYKQKYFVPFLGQASKKHAACMPLFPSFLLVEKWWQLVQWPQSQSWSLRLSLAETIWVLGGPCLPTSRWLYQRGLNLLLM